MKFLPKKKGFFGKGPKKNKVIDKKANTRFKSTNTKTKKPARYQYSIVQSKDTRVKTYNNREQAIIDLNKKKETQPGNKYRLVKEKKPSYKMF